MHWKIQPSLLLCNVGLHLCAAGVCSCWHYCVAHHQVESVSYALHYTIGIIKYYVYPPCRVSATHCLCDYTPPCCSYYLQLAHMCCSSITFYYYLSMFSFPCVFLLQFSFPSSLVHVPWSNHWWFWECKSTKQKMVFNKSNSDTYSRGPCVPWSSCSMVSSFVSKAARRWSAAGGTSPCSGGEGLAVA